ncbi:MAG: T9SS C-terminal target domain-containing protein, partial [Bacteroidetes bacterium]
LGIDETVDIPVRARYMNEWSGYQFTLEFDPNSLEVYEILPGELPNLYAEENFNLFDLESGLITTIWHEFDAMADGREMTLFSLRCRAKQPVAIKDALYLSSRLTAAEAVSQDGEVGTITLSFEGTMAETGVTFELYQNRPNPWTNSTIIPFELDPGGDASLSIYDMAGKQVYRTEGYYTSGYHEISVSRHELPAVGLFYYTLEAGDQRATRKMVLTD